MKRYLALLFVLVVTNGFASGVTLIWDYDFAAPESVDVDSFRVYAVRGENTPFQPGNTNATVRVNVFFGIHSGLVTNLQYTVSGLLPGPWTFTVTAVNKAGVESENATPITAMVEPDKPGKPVNLRL